MTYLNGESYFPMSARGEDPTVYLRVFRDEDGCLKWEYRDAPTGPTTDKNITDNVNKVVPPIFDRVGGQF